MATAIARIKELRVAPRKARLVANLIRGKKVAEARGILEFTLKKTAPALRKLLESAVANAEHAATEHKERIDTDEMVIRKIVVDEGRTTRRYRPAARGRATRIRKRTSQVELTISDE